MFSRSIRISIALNKLCRDKFRLFLLYFRLQSLIEWHWLLQNFTFLYLYRRDVQVLILATIVVNLTQGQRHNSLFSNLPRLQSRFNTFNISVKPMGRFRGQRCFVQSLFALLLPLLNTQHITVLLNFVLDDFLVFDLQLFALQLLKLGF
jgi:hypothetical protein